MSCCFPSKSFYLSQSLSLFFFHNTSFFLNFSFLSSFFASCLFLYPTYIAHLLFMSPVKSEGSSRCKGKETTVDPPLVKGEGGEEAPLSKLEHSEEEGVSRDLDNECAPLIDHGMTPILIF